MNLRRVPLLVIVFGLLLLTLSCSPKETRIPKGIQSSADIALPVGDFSLTERSGKKMSNRDLEGNVWVASFVFTRCSGPCPQVTATIARLQKELAGVENLKFVTFTVDPERDQLGDLKKYAEQYRADPERWYFLTGDEKEIHNLLKSSFKMGIFRAENPKPGEEFDHSTRIAVVDKSGVIRAFGDGIISANGGPEAEKDFEANLKAFQAKILELAKVP